MEKALKRVGLEETLAKPRGPSAIVRVLKAVSYGPFGSIQSAVVGFILGTVAFRVRDAFVAEHNVVVELPLLLMLSLGGALALLTVAMAANYMIGRRVRDEVELQARILAGEAFMIPTPRADLPGIDLLVSNGATPRDGRKREAEARTREVA